MDEEEEILDSLETEIPVETDPTDPVPASTPEDLEAKLASISQGVSAMGYINQAAPGAQYEQVGEYIDPEFGKYKQDFEVANVDQAQSLQEFRGYTQTVADKWGNGLIKFGGKTLTNVVGSTIGLGYGIYAGVRDGEFNSFYNNEFARGIDDVNKYMDGALPNHYTVEERKKGIWDQMGTANFWSDQVMNGMSFVAGAVMTEMLTAGMGSAMLGASFARMQQATRLLKNSARANKIEGVLGRGAEFMNRKNILEGSTIIRQLATGASYESGVEARHSYDTVKDNRTTAILIQKGLDPSTMSEDEKINALTVKERQGIEDEAARISNGVFAGNFALVGMSNMLMLPKLYGTGAKRIIADLPLIRQTLAGASEAGQTTKQLAKKYLTDTAAGRFAKKVGNAARTETGKKVGDVARTVGSTLGTAGYEGFVEEGLQGAMGRAAGDYALLSGIREDAGINDLFDSVYDSFTQGAKESYTTTDGLKEVVIGAMLGGLGMPGVNLTALDAHRDTKERREYIDKLTKLQQEHPDVMNSLRAHGSFFMNVSKRSKLLDSAYEGGDLALVKNLEHDNFFDFVMSKIITGQYEDIETQTQDILDSSEQEFRELGGYTTESLPSSEVNARKIEVVEATKKRAAKIREAVEKVDAELRLSEREKVLDSEKPGTMGYLRKQLIHNLSVIDNVQEREEALIKEVAKLTGGKISSVAWSIDKDGKGSKEDRTSTIDYTDAEGNTKSVDIGAFYEDAPIRASIAKIENIIKALEAGEKTEEVKKQLDELYDRKLELSEYAKEVGEDNILTGEEYENLIKPWLAADPDGVAINGEQVQTYLKDLRKLRARRQTSVEMYKQLMDPTYRPQAIQSIQEKINAMDTDLTEEEKKAKERKEKKEKKSIETFKSKIVEAKKVTLRQIETFENQLKETQDLIDSYIGDLAEIVNKLETGQKIRKKNGQFMSKKDVLDLINNIEGTITEGETILQDAAKDRDSLIESLTIIEEFEQNPPNLDTYAAEMHGSVEQMMATLGIEDDLSSYRLEMMREIKGIKDYHTEHFKAIDDATKEIKAALVELYKKRNFLSKLFYENIDYDLSSDLALSELNLDEIPEWYEKNKDAILKDREFLNKELRLTEDAIIDLRTENAIHQQNKNLGSPSLSAAAAALDDSYMRLYTFSKIESMTGKEKDTSSPTKPSKDYDYSFEDASTSKEDTTVLRKPDLTDTGFSRTITNHKKDLSKGIKEGALDTYKELKDIDNPTVDEQRKLAHAVSVLRFHNWKDSVKIGANYSKTTKRTYYSHAVAAITVDNIPEELGDMLTEEDFYRTSEEIEQNLPSSEIKLVVFENQKSTWNKQTDKYDNVNVNEFVTVEDEHGKGLVFANSMLPTLDIEGRERFRDDYDLEDSEKEDIRAAYESWRNEIINEAKETQEIFLYPIKEKSIGELILNKEPEQNSGKLNGKNEYSSVPLYIGSTNEGLESVVGLPVGKVTVATRPGLVWAQDTARQMPIPMVGRMLSEEEVMNASRLLHLFLKKREEFIAEEKKKKTPEAFKAAMRNLQAFTIEVEGKKVNLKKAIEDLVYYQSSKKEKDNVDFQLYHNKGSLVFGASEQTIELKDFEEGSESAVVGAFNEFLALKYHNVNKGSLGTETSGWVELVLDENLEVDTDKTNVSWKNYNEYLLKDRDIGQSPLMTRATPIFMKETRDGKTVNFRPLDAPRALGGYIKFDPSERKRDSLAGRRSGTPAIKTKFKTKEEKAQAESEQRIIDGVTQNLKDNGFTPVPPSQDPDQSPTLESAIEAAKKRNEGPASEQDQAIEVAKKQAQESEKQDIDSALDMFSKDLVFEALDDKNASGKRLEERHEEGSLTVEVKGYVDEWINSNSDQDAATVDPEVERLKGTIESLTRTLTRPIKAGTSSTHVLFDAEGSVLSVGYLEGTDVVDERDNPVIPKANFDINIRNAKKERKKLLDKIEDLQSDIAKKESGSNPFVAPGKDEADNFLTSSYELSSDDYIKEEYGEELARVKGMTSAEIVPVIGMVKGMSGEGYAMLRKDGKILVSSLAPGGALYHEAYHDVSLTMLSKEDREKIYNTVRNIKGEAVPYQEIAKGEQDRSYKPKSKPFSEFTNKETEEWLAEEFRRYVLSKGKYTIGKDTVTPKEETFFKKLFNFIRNTFRAMFNLDKALDTDFDLQGVEELFAKIESGGFKNAQRHLENLESQDDVMMSAKLAGETTARFTADLNSTLTAYFADALQGGTFTNEAGEEQDISVRFEDFLDLSTGERNAQIRMAYFNAWTNMYNDLLLKYNSSKEGSEEQKHTLSTLKHLYGDEVTGRQRRRETVDLHKQFLAELGVDFEAEDSRDEDEVSSKMFSDVSDKMEVSPTDSAKGVVKLLLGTIPITTGETNSTGLKGVYELKTVLKTLQTNLESTLDFSNQLEIIDALSEDYAWAPQVLERLGEYQMDAGTSLETVLLHTAVRSQFAKTMYDTQYTILQENGRIGNINPSLERNLKSIRARWDSYLRGKEKTSAHMKMSPEGSVVFDPKAKASFNRKKLDLTEIRSNVILKGYGLKLDALEHIGITFSNREKLEDILSIDPERTLKNSDITYKEALEDGLAFVYGDLIKGSTTLASLFSREEAQSVTRMNALARLELETTKMDYEFQHQNPEGKIVYSISLNNYLSTIANTAIDKLKSVYYSSKKNLSKNPYAFSSLALKALGENPDSKIDILIREGLTIEGAGEVGVLTSKLRPTDNLVSYIESIMQGEMPLIQAADISTNFAIRFPIQNFKTIESAKEAFLGYLKDEIMAVNKARKEGIDVEYFTERINRPGIASLRLFESLMSKTDSSVLDRMSALMDDPKAGRVAIDSFVNENADNIFSSIESNLKVNMRTLKDYMLDLKVIVDNENGTYQALGLNRQHFGETLSENISSEQLDTLLEEVITKQTIYKNETFKVFFGDPAFYKALFKRIKGAAGVKDIFNVDLQLDKWLNESENARAKYDGRKSDGTEDLAVIQEPERITPYYEEYLETLSPEIAAAYRKAADKADGTLLLTLPAYREMALRGNTWSPDLERSYEKVMRGDTITEEEYGKFPPLKFQYFGYLPNGNVDTQVPGFFKMSAAPIYPGLAKMGNKTFPGILNMYEFLTSNKLGGFILPSAFKIGVPGEAGQLQLMDGNVIRSSEDLTSSFSEGQKVNIDYTFMGTQLEVPSKFKGKSPLATQARVQVLSDLFEDGQLREEFKELAPTVERYNEVLNGLIDRGYKELLDELNLVESTDDQGVRTYTVKNQDYSKFLDAIKNESIKRQMPMQLMASLEKLQERNDAKKPIYFDAVSNKGRLEGVLWSLAGKRVIRQKFDGDMYVQQSSLGFETAKIDDVPGLRLEELKPYTIGDQYMEVYLPHHFKEMVDKDVVITEDGIFSDGELIGGLDLVEMIGIRIPTDGIHSIEAIKVKGFLPRSQGPTVVIPSEMVTKSGSDFDIDKLVLYFPSYKKVGNKLVKEEFYNSLEEWYDAQDRITPEELEQLKGDSLTQALVYNFTKSVGKQSFEDWKKENPKATKYNVQSRGAMQNAVMEDMIALLQAKGVTNEAAKQERFDTWMQPVNTNDAERIALKLNGGTVTDPKTNKKTFVEGIYKGAKRLPDLANITDYNLNTDIPTLIKVSEAFNKGKTLVGIAALASTHNIKGQMAGLRLNVKDQFIKLPGKTAAVRLNFEGFDPLAESYSLGRTRNINGTMRVSDALSQLVNASVDVVNTPILHVLNITPDNANMWMFLLRAGVDMETIAMFANQPIVKDYLSLLEVGRSKTMKVMEKSQYDEEIIQSLRTTYANSYKVPETESNVKAFNAAILSETVAQDSSALTDSQKHDQLQILMDMMVYNKVGESLGNIVTAQSFDTKIPKNRNHLKVVLDMYESAVSTDLFENVEQISGMNIPGSVAAEELSETDESEPANFMRAMTSYNFSMQTVFNEMFLTEGAGEQYQDDFRKVQKIFTNPEIKGLSVDDKARILSKFEDGFISFIIQNAYKEGLIPLGDNIESLMFGDDSMANRLQKIQDPKGEHPLRDNPFILSLVPVLAVSREGKERTNDYLQPINRTMTSYEMRTVFDGFNEIRGVDPDLAREFVQTALLQSGVGSSRTSFLNTIPGDFVLEYMEGSLDSYFDGSSEINIEGSYFDRFFMDNHDDRQIVPKDTGYSRKIYPFTYKVSSESVKARQKALREGLPLPKFQKYYYRNFSADKSGKASNSKKSVTSEVTGSRTFVNMTDTIRIPSNTIVDKSRISKKTDEDPDITCYTP